MECFKLWVNLQSKFGSNYKSVIYGSVKFYGICPRTSLVTAKWVLVSMSGENVQIFGIQKTMSKWFFCQKLIATFFCSSILLLSTEIAIFVSKLNWTEFLVKLSDARKWKRRLLPTTKKVSRFNLILKGVLVLKI